MLGLALSVLTVAEAQTRDTSVPRAASLRDEVQKANANGDPLLVLVSLDGCPYCKMARENYLTPLREQGVLVVQVDMQSSALVRDFDGEASTHDAWIRTRKVKVAPSLFFFGPQGRELAPPLVGAVESDFYGAYLDGRLEQARTALKGR